MALQDMKTIADFLIADFEDEMRTTASVLAFVPADHRDYRPDAIKHSVHHRGQLSTYLRAMGGKVPGIYGPSADTQVAAV
jgi:hypothetical protein